MGLFYRREDPQVEALYRVSTGMETTVLIVGLGNTGQNYSGTRHNIGFACLDAWAEAEQGTWTEKKPLKSQLCDLRIGNNRVLLCKPTTMMNLSGEAVKAVQQFYKISNSRTIVVHDELDIPFGQLRMRVGGSAAGNNGVKSIIQHCGEEFGRVRIGIHNDIADKADSADFVLGKFTKTEQTQLKPLQNEVLSVLNEAVFAGQLAAETRTFLP